MTTPSDESQSAAQVVARQLQTKYELSGQLPGGETKQDYIRFSSAVGIMDKPGVNAWRERNIHSFYIDHFEKVATIMGDDSLLPEQRAKSVKNEFEVRNDVALFLGTAVHRMAERYLRGLPQLPRDINDENLAPYMPTIEAFVKDLGVEPVHIETPLVNTALGVAGCTDLFANTKNFGFCELDYKTSKRSAFSPYGAKTDNAIQGVFYGHAEYGIDTSKYVIEDKIGFHKNNDRLFHGDLFENKVPDNIGIVNLQPAPFGYAVTWVKHEDWEELGDELERRVASYRFAQAEKKYFDLNTNPPLIQEVTPG